MPGYALLPAFFLAQSHLLTGTFFSLSQIEMRNGQVFLIDAGSTNGTQLNKYG
jgi:hypothetical protein